MINLKGIKPFILFIPVFLLNAGTVLAQSVCPQINAGADVTLPCGVNCTVLNATPLNVGATDNYTVSQIAYSPAPYTGGTPILANVDDEWSDIIPLPFTFCFFGQSYSYIVIGSNGIVTFDTTVATGVCDWQLNDKPPVPTNLLPTASIMSPYQDLDPTFTGEISYQTLGTAPCRTFVVSWTHIPYYGDPNSATIDTFCTQTNFATQQIVLYETTHVIDINIKKKTSICNDTHDPNYPVSAPNGYWNSALAIEGIQNETGTIAYTVPGRNDTVWDATNDSWRFYPSGAPIYTVNWYKGATQIGTGNSIQVCPSAQTTYTAKAVYTPCGGGTPVTVTDDVIVSLTGSLNAGVDSFKNITCHGANNGKVYAHVSGGVAPVTYGWSNGSTALSLTNLSAGTYVLTAVDANTCLRSDTVIITEPATVNVSVPNVNITTCTGAGTGSLTAVPAGGTLPYTYNWNNGQAGIADTNIAAGSYTVTLTDASGCTATGSGTLTITLGASTVVMGAPQINDASCYGASDGSITANVSGGSVPYNYAWSDTQTGITAFNLIQGTYTVTVVDAGGCTASATYNVNQPAQFNLAPPFIQSTGCNGAADGVITAYVSGGIAPYSYDWTEQSNGQPYSGQTISNLVSDYYDLTITDANSCQTTVTYQVQQLTPVYITTDSTNVSCFGGNDGMALVTVTVGIPPYQYNWNNTGNSNNASLTGLSAGTINVVVTDSNYCTATASFNITQPAQLVITKLSQTNVLCNGGVGGSVTISASGGTPSYTYLWSNNVTSTTDTLLPAGNVTVTVTDSKLCQAVQTYSITEPAALVSNPVTEDARCYLGADGSIDANASGGTPPYAYVWSDSSKNQIDTYIPAGSYTVTVTDANGCSAQANGLINQPTAMLLSDSTTPVKCLGDKNGTIIVTATGGTPGYSYSATQDMSNFLFTTDGIILGADTGIYTVIVSDSNGCTKTIPAVVENATPNSFETEIDSTLCYGPAYNDGAVLIVATSLQNAPYQYSIDGGALQDTGYFPNLSAGLHYVVSVNKNGCRDTTPALVQQPLPIVVVVSPDTVTLPLGESKQVQVQYINATNPTYTWSPSLGLSCIDCPNPIVGPYTSTDYIVTVSMVNKTATCYGSASLHAEVLQHKPVFIPNAFSPTGDGNNDRFLVYGEDIKTVDMKIFNRWGELVFESSNGFEGWDGTYRGQLVMPQVFTYTSTITFLDNSQVHKAGSVTVIR
jgi:gliding motility-associated-like protein